MSSALRGGLAILSRVAVFTRLGCLLRNRLTEQGIEVHRRNMIAKLDVPCSISAVRLALEAEL